MARLYVFGDEAGNFDFRRTNGASAHFIVATVSIDGCEIGHELLELRRELAYQGAALESTFHATQDPQIVRDEVFRLIQSHEFRVDATILEKAKTLPRLQRDTERFYKTAWFMHLKHVLPRVATKKDELLVVVASIGTKKRQRGIRLGIEDVVDQSVPLNHWEVAFWPCASDPCLQIADYCTWAIQRKWERGDERSYALIADKVKTEFAPFRMGSTTYY